MKFTVLWNEFGKRRQNGARKVRQLDRWRKRRVAGNRGSFVIDMGINRIVPRAIRSVYVPNSNLG